MPRIAIQFTGMGQVAGSLAVGMARFPREVKKALREEMEVEKKEVVARTPIDTGALRASIKVLEPTKDIKSYSVTIIAGGDNVNPKSGKTTKEYAIDVHENPDAYHPVGQWKYLESVIRESAPYMVRRVANRIEMRKIFR
jgi:hypothetical protein